jgi:RepB DNA-primase from phage plasmid
VDRRTASEYIRDNFQPEDRLAVVLLNKPTGHVLQRVATADKIADDRYQAWLRHMNARRYEVYVSMNTLKPSAHGRTKADIRDIRHVYLDLDEGGQAKLEALRAREELPQPNWVLQSSPGKFQVVWKVEGFDGNRAEEVMRGLVESTGADPAATDISRVLRLPGFRNHKYGGDGHLVSAVRLHGEVRLVGDFPAPKPTARADSLRIGGGRRPGTRPGGTSQSERDWAYAKRALRRGDAVDVVIRAIEDHRRGDKPNAAYYARHTVEKASAAISNERVSSFGR